MHHEDTVRQTPVRSYSYQGEVITCQNSKANSKLGLQGSTGKEVPNQFKETNHFDYCHQTYNQHPKSRQIIQPANDNRQAPYFQTRGRQNSSASQKQAQRYKKQVVARDRQIEKLAQRVRENEDYGKREMTSARKKMEKEAKKLRKLYKSRVERNIHEIENNQVMQLEEQIRQLKIRTLEFEKEKLAQQLTQSVEVVKQRRERLDSRQRTAYNKGNLILNKPRYQPAPCGGENTDSSFSSFQFE